MGTVIIILRIIFGIFFAFAGIMHFIKPKIFNRFIPNFLPKLVVNYIAGLLELAIGIGLLINQTTKQAALAMFILMLIFLPIHIWDVFRDKPAIGSKKIAIIRVPLQFLLLYIAYLIYTY
ncbi:MauE/DoxX family redox-associated membrane protein [Tenacibaculum larymnensis]|uniref:DoxX family membrane protein n=1 Tax=Tenacibaculum larymnensis TaxID=2878201 RepID=A0A9X4ESS9_9FLAO|nr:MauE/DoxX family redox-associated membrane protein [Tenacibaculum larymnensis]MDE1205912.1 DoxX family membrane protein [Tenacibaculum larymnensis]